MRVCQFRHNCVYDTKAIACATSLMNYIICLFPFQPIFCDFLYNGFVFLVPLPTAIIYQSISLSKSTEQYLTLMQPQSLMRSRSPMLLHLYPRSRLQPLNSPRYSPPAYLYLQDSQGPSFLLYKI